MVKCDSPEVDCLGSGSVSGSLQDLSTASRGWRGHCYFLATIVGACLARAGPDKLPGSISVYMDQA